MITDPVRERSQIASKPSAAERLARIARSAPTEAEAIAGVKKALEDLLS